MNGTGGRIRGELSKRKAVLKNKRNKREKRLRMNETEPIFHSLHRVPTHGEAKDGRGLCRITPEPPSMIIIEVRVREETTLSLLGDKSEANGLKELKENN